VGYGTLYFLPKKTQNDTDIGELIVSWPVGRGCSVNSWPAKPVLTVRCTIQNVRRFTH